MNHNFRIRLRKDNGVVHIFGTVLFLILAFLVWSWFNSQREASHVDAQLDISKQRIEILERRVRALEDKLGR